MTTNQQTYNAMPIANKQSHACRLLYRTAAFVLTALLAVAIKSPQAVAQSAAFAPGKNSTTGVIQGSSMVIGSAGARAQAPTVSSADIEHSLPNQWVGDGFSASTNVQPLHVTTHMQQRTVLTRIRPIVRFIADLAPGSRKMLRKDAPAITAVIERVTKWNDVVVDRQVVSKRLVQRGQPGIIGVGPPRNVSEALALTRFRKLVGVFAMVATAYTAGSAQSMPSGRTATGARARYGVVAVDPRVIPLGAHVFIPGYGTAIAADTGSSIVGNRIDLCMDTLQAALSFGRQSVKVYVLQQ